MIKIGIMTYFRELSHSSSLVQVTAHHIEMLLAHQYSIKLMVCENCKKEGAPSIYLDPRIEWVELPNHYQTKPIMWENYYDPRTSIPEHFMEQVSFIQTHMEKALEDIDLCMLHDIHYHIHHAIHHLALRQALEHFPKLPIIAFTHSLPYFRPAIIPSSSKLLFTPLPHTLYVYPTCSGLSALALQYHIPEAHCYKVYHPIVTLHHPIVKKIHTVLNLFTPTFLIIYPARLCPEKKQDKIIALAGALKLVSGKKVSIVFCDAILDSPPEAISTYKQLLSQTAVEYGLGSKDFLFTSSLGYTNGIPHEAITELFGLSNLFICPSISESFSLTVLEAASQGNFIVYNQNVPALKEIGTLLHGYPMKWDAYQNNYSITQNYPDSEASYYGYHAQAIYHLYKQNPLFYSRTYTRCTFNCEWIWHHQMAPLIQEAFALTSQ